ncbi:hypothetical protein FACS1894110_27010 [Spirochaetia bacterium]|nr:hypothetical protein FACS1894110_27010 [Spirochaetia bacterium]
MKINISVFIIAAMLIGCGSTPTQIDKSQQVTSEEPLPPSASSAQSGSAMTVDTRTNTFNGILVDVVGTPYEYKDICGYRAMDDLIEKEYKLMSTGQSSTFDNFSIDKFIFNFTENGGLVVSTVYSYDKTPSANGGFYPAQSGRVHDWKLEPKYHRHSGGDCSIDFYNDIAVSQAKLNEMRRDPSLEKVYNILLSVAEDMDYNYPAIGRKATFVTLPNGKEPLKGVCDDYSNLLIDRLTVAKINGVSNIQKVTGQNHAWVTLVYKGKTLYLDATWFDKNNIDENGVVDHTPYKDPRNMTFDNEIFTNHNQHHIAGGTRNIGS